MFEIHAVLVRRFAPQNRLIAFCVAICMLFCAANGARADFLNGGFEAGNLDGWTREYATYLGNNTYSPWSTALPPGLPAPVVVTSLSFGTVSNLPPLCGSYTARINDLTGGSHATRISQSVVLESADVGPSGVHIHVQWTAVLEDPGHEAPAQPRFDIVVRKNSVPVELAFSADASAHNDPGSGWLSAGDAYWYKTDAFDSCVRASVGDAISVTMTVADCSLGQHGGMAFIDCAEIRPSSSDCPRTEVAPTAECGSQHPTCAPGDTVWIADWNFDGGAPCNANGWTAAAAYGPPNARLRQHLLDNDGCSENTSCGWLFTNAGTPSCWPDMAFSEGGLIIGSSTDEYILSPWVSLATTPSACRTRLSYRVFPGNPNLGPESAMLNWSVRSMAGAATTPWVHTSAWNTLDLFRWTTKIEDLTPFVSPDATAVQVRLRVRNSTTCVGPGPFLDRVRIGRGVLTGPVIDEGVDSRSQAQDCFPGLDDGGGNATPRFEPTTNRFGTSPFSRSAELDPAQGPNVNIADSIHVQVTGRCGVPIVSVSWCGAIVAGPHAGKAPAPWTVGPNGFFCVTPDSCRDAGGAVIRDHYFVDLDDTYFRGGDVVEYYWAAVDAAGGFATDPCGMAGSPASVRAAEQATDGLLEVSFLPAITWSPAYLARIAADLHGDLDPTPSEITESHQRNCILYVQMVDSRRRSGDTHRTAFMYTLDLLGYRGHYDVYDLQGSGNTNNHLGSRATLAQATGYGLIIQDTCGEHLVNLPDGSVLDDQKIDQAGWYRAYLASANTSEIGTSTLWLIGNNIAEEKRTNPLITVDMGVDFRIPSGGFSSNPNVQGIDSFTWANGSTSLFTGQLFALHGGCPTARDYDGLNWTGDAVGTHIYTKDNPPTWGFAAVVMNKSVPTRWNTILSAFSWADIADKAGLPPGTSAMDLARPILNGTLPLPCQQAPGVIDVPPGDETPGVPSISKLYQSTPNPFNPTTTIRFDLARAGRVRLQVFDLRGKRVRILVDGDLEAGRHQVAWSGQDESGSRVASGAYFCRLTSGAFTATQRMLIVK